MTNITRRTFAAGALGTAIMLALGASQASAQTTYRLSHHLQPGHLVDVASKRFAELVSEKTNGQIKIEVFPAGQIAGLRQGAEAVQIGTVDFVWTDFGTLANWQPEYGFVSLPFLFQGNDHFKAVFGGEIGKELGESVKSNLGAEILGYGNAGFRVIASKEKAIKAPGDLAGVRIRVPEVPVFVSTFSTVGANPTPMAWGEVYTALQTGVIDAVENPPEGLAVGGMDEVTKYLTETNHIMTDVNLLGNGGLIDGMSPENQEAVRSAAATALEEFNAATAAASGKYLEELGGNMEVVADPDIAAFQEAMKPVWAKFTETTGAAGQGWIDKVVAAGN